MFLCFPESNSGGAHDNFHQNTARDGVTFSVSDLLASSAVSSNAPSVDSGFVDSINAGLNGNSGNCNSSNGGGGSNIQYKVNNGSGFFGNSSSVQITSRSYPNTPFPDGSRNVFWSSAGSSHFQVRNESMNSPHGIRVRVLHEIVKIHEE